jgi:GT2 family glycosyltransferase
MLFSVVIPTYNRLKYLPETLASVRAQRFSDFETIVVDDGSTDGTRDYLATLGSGVRVVLQNNLGPGAARNAGVAAARGQYIAFLDSDDLWFPWTLEVIATIAAQSSPAVIAGSFVPFHDESELTPVRESAVVAGTFQDYLSSASDAISVGGCAAIVARSAFLESGGFFTRKINAEDHDLVLRLGVAPGFAAVRQPVTVGWRRHTGTETGDLTKMVDGMRYLVAEERAGRYPGGPMRAHERRRIITRHVRPITFACLRERRPGDAFQLYATTFSWNLRAGHLAYLAAFPLLGAWASLKSAA